MWKAGNSLGLARDALLRAKACSSSGLLRAGLLTDILPLGLPSVFPDKATMLLAAGCAWRRALGEQGPVKPGASGVPAVCVGDVGCLRGVSGPKPEASC